MRGVIDQLATDILFAFYQPLGYSLLTAYFFMYFYIFSYKKYETGHGIKATLLIWKDNFKEDKAFRRLYILVFYVMLMLFRTLMNRNQWVNPLYEIFDGWWIYHTNTITGEIVLTADCIENILLFIPYIFLILYYLRTIDYKKSFSDILKLSIRVAFITSFTIEFLQMVLRLGSVQLSDLVYNTLGGVIG